MANEKELTEDQKPFVPADTVDSKGTAWPTVGENIRKGVNGELADVYDRMPDLDGVGEFWSKMLGVKCKAFLVEYTYNEGKTTINNSFFRAGSDGFYALNNTPPKFVSIIKCHSSLNVDGLCSIRTNTNNDYSVHMHVPSSDGSLSATILVVCVV